MFYVVIVAGTTSGTGTGAGGAAAAAAGPARGPGASASANASATASASGRRARTRCRRRTPPSLTHRRSSRRRSGLVLRRTRRIQNESEGSGDSEASIVEMTIKVV